MIETLNAEPRQNKYLDVPLVDFGRSAWTVRNAVEGVQIFGGIGSGKTSGSGRLLALKFLAAGFGGLVLTVKPDEKDLWVKYCTLAGRSSDDLLIVEPGRGNTFNFLEYESTNGDTANIVEVLKTVIRARDASEGGGGDDRFWEVALDMLMFNVVDLCRLAYGAVTVQWMYDIVQSIPKSKPVAGMRVEGAFYAALDAAERKARFAVGQWEERQSTDRLEDLAKAGIYDETVRNEVPAARLFSIVEQFFKEQFLTLAEKTRSIIDFSFSGLLFRLLRDPVYTLFCNASSTFTPAASRAGRIILLNLPVKTHYKIGQDAQILFKYIWQRAMEKGAAAEEDSRPVFLWADEAQNFLHEHDAEFQATARSSLIATVYLSQNLPNYYANMGGGTRGEYRVKSFLGTLATKIFHANADIETNRYASELIGDTAFEETSEGIQAAGEFSASRTKHLKFDRSVRPEDFPRLKTGGKRNNSRVSAYVHFQGNVLAKGACFTKTQFDQNYPSTECDATYGEEEDSVLPDALKAR